MIQYKQFYVNELFHIIDKHSYNIYAITIGSTSHYMNFIIKKINEHIRISNERFDINKPYIEHVYGGYYDENLNEI